MSSRRNYDADLKDDEELTDVVIEAKRLESEAVKKAEAGNVDEAIEILSQSIQLAPRRPSGYNNRAQAFRLKGNVSAAIEDLNNTINLSGGKGKSACLAFCQRALIYRLQNKQQEAVADFEMAATLGSAFARSQLVLMNPYAALCNQMLRKVLAQYR
ncbi:tetratricopeptide repeat protein 36 [Nephila pilipes]|uniref:Tetratricopeptide repeat protein 36 n=1 Tax=Nephila pilipes TaxID=299642 RepID=A0A8X6MSM7_NEPPI|nr:tetratricopeptide repeat protein 36 [Nephila pilipes]